MKIIIFSDDFPPQSFGGAGIIAESQALELARRGHHVRIITAAPDEEPENTLTRDGLTVSTVHSVLTIKRILHQEMPDVVHIHNVHQALSYKVFPISRKYSKKVFFTAHDAMSVHYSKIFPKVIWREDRTPFFDYRVSGWHQLHYFWRQWRPFRNFLIRFHLRKVDGIFAVSKALQEALEQNGIDNVQVMHNGIDPDSFMITTEKISAFKNKYNLEGKKVLFFSGRVSQAKGIGVCLSLIREISKTIPEVYLVIAGRENDYVRDILSSPAMDETRRRIVFTGWLDRNDVVSAYHSSSLVPVLSLYMDPFPTTNLEAMAAKKPVVGTFFGGTPEIVKNGETGFIVDPRDFDSTLDKCLMLLRDDPLSEKFGQAGFDRVSQEFRLSQQIDRLEKIYAESH